MLFLLCMLMSFLCSASEREPSRVLSSDNMSISVDVSSLTATPDHFPSEEDLLCDMALSKYKIPECDISKFIKPYFLTAVKNSPKHGDDKDESCGIDVLRRFRSGDNLPSATTTSREVNTKNDDDRIHEMVVKAIHKAFEEKERALIKKEAALKKRYSGKFVASLTAIVGGLTTIITSICTAFITMHADK